jgi:Flp pilus assembly protein TadD
MGSASSEKTSNRIASIFYIQLAAFIAEEKDYYNVRLGEIFARMQALNYSIEKYQKISNESMFYLRAQLGIVDALVDKGQSEKATKVLQTLIKKGFNEFALFDSLADIFRAKEDYATAIKYYDRALVKFDEKIKPNKWATFFVRGIAHDQTGNWEQAKVDLNTALRLNPNHPEVLNYFGYSLIERNESLDKALGMIEDAAVQKPESGYIIDSLAWGLFRLGQYKEAIGPMERAIELEPHDPIVNDHLGDILWMTGRKREATFQWNRALLFGPTEENEKKIKKKLKFGLTDL